MLRTNVRILDLMNEQHLTQKRLAEYLQVSYPALNNYLNGRRWPDLQTFRKLAQILNTTTDYLLLLSDEPHPKQLNSDEQKLLAAYQTLSPAKKRSILNQIIASQ